MEYIELFELILNLVGGSALISAAIPVKVKQYFPVIGQVLEILGANFANAKNKHD